jgi:hypothetical protein
MRNRPEPPVFAVVADRLAALRGDVNIHVILEVLADAGQVMGDVDAQRSQLVGRSDARKEQQFGRIHCAAAQDNLIVGVDDLLFALVKEL